MRLIRLSNTTYINADLLTDISIVGSVARVTFAASGDRGAHNVQITAQELRALQRWLAANSEDATRLGEASQPT